MTEQTGSGRTEPSSDVRPYAVFTIVHNESLFLRLWCNYYCWLPDVDAYVLDDSSSDGSVEDAKRRFPKLTVHRVEPGGRYDLVRLRERVEDFQRKLLEEYEVVVYTDVDEFLLTANHEGLVAFLERFRRSGEAQARATGWHCVHRVGEEPPMALMEGESVLKDRSVMQTLPKYDKVLISKIPSRWTNGFHGCEGMDRLKPDPNLALFHAWMIDYGAFMRKPRSYMGSAVKRYFESYLHAMAKRAIIPDEWKALVRW